LGRRSRGGPSRYPIDAGRSPGVHVLMDWTEPSRRKRMRIWLNVVLSLRCVALMAGTSRATRGPEPIWAYGFPAPPSPADEARPPLPLPHLRNLRADEPVEEQTRIRKVEGSLAAYSRVDVRDGGNVADWFPGDHPPMPNVIAHGPASQGRNAWGCAYCHLPTGKGRPENAPVSGLPAAYFIRQLQDFRDGNRMSADPRKPNTPLMANLARAMSDEEMRQAAEYFGSMKSTPWTRVVETDLVPTTRIVGNLFIATSTVRTEPIAGRIIEVPEDEEQSEALRNPHSGFVAYVPVGSIKKGEALATTGGAGRTFACIQCHGPDLKGLADIPGIAGRSPSYLVRQIFDFQVGTRRGKMSSLMQPVVVHLAPDDMVAIAAYVTSLVPPSAPRAN
jgi:cytochrome c553